MIVKKSGRKSRIEVPYLYRNREKKYSVNFLSENKQQESGIKYFSVGETIPHRQPRILHPVKLSFKSEGEIKNF